MTLRVPRAALPDGLGEAMIEQLGAVPEPTRAMYNAPAVATAVLELSAKANDWDAAPVGLKTLAHMAVAARVGCSWCLDVGYFFAIDQRLDPAKASQVPRWREAECSRRSSARCWRTPRR